MPRILRLLILGFLAGLLLYSFTASLSDISAQPPTAKAEDQQFQTKVLPFLNQYCNNCHNSDKNSGGISLDTYKTLAEARKDRKAWEMVQRVLANQEMPPKKNKEQPLKNDSLLIADYVEKHVTSIDCGLSKNAGRVTLRRLNRNEYNNTVRDLCGIEFKPADDFPSDDVGYGFDNIGDVLSVQPILLEKYLRAADKVLEQALTRGDRIPSSKQTYRPQNIRVMPADAKSREPRVRITFSTTGEAFLEKFNFPATGEYYFRFRVWGTKVSNELPQFSVKVNGNEIKTFSVEAAQDKPITVEHKARIEAGECKVSVHFLNPSSDKSRQFGLETIEIEGPIGGAAKPLTEAQKRIFVSLPEQPGDNAKSAKSIIAEFARRAYRRPVQPQEVERLLKLYSLAESKGEPFSRAIQLPLKAILCSPHFLFRVEEDPKAPETIRTINEFELASRLSYFLWSSMPDEELFKLAAEGRLRQPGVLKAQVTRMLKDKKSIALTENFAGQWLQLRNLKTLSPDTEQFKNWDDGLRNAMIREAELFFEHIVKNDKSILDFLDADYTFVNDRLSWHYGIPNIRGNEFRMVKHVKWSQRGGITTLASILTVTSNPTRTSPVKRGKWIYENILGLQPPPPAPDVPELPPVGQLKGTLRQQMEQHRANASCAGCHAKLDPLGFGLENYDAIGTWRDLDNKQKIDSSGVLPDGATFNGPAELRKILLGKSEMFRRCLADKLLTFALGRGLDYYDKCALDNIVTQLKAGEDRFSALVLAIVESDPFQKRQQIRSEK